jgi:hypothetical protein
MSRSPAAKSPAVVPAARAAAPAWQTAATVLIILHLFCLGIGLATNVAGGKSLLSPALYRIPGAHEYLRFLWMNVGYDFHIASPVPEDGTHRLRLIGLPNFKPAAAEAEAPTSIGAEAPPPAEIVELPSADVWPRIRRQRYQQLAYHVALLDEMYAEIADTRTALPLAIAQRWLRDLGAPQESYVLACDREPSLRLPKAIERAPSARPREGGPKSAGPAVYTTETITVYLVWDPETASYQGSRAEPVGQTSEVVRASDAAPAAANPPAIVPPAVESTEAPAPLETSPPAPINPADAN